MTDYAGEFLTVVIVHLLAVASPGPDFAMVLRQSLVAGRKAALWTSIGIGAGILVHICYSLLGIGLIISQSVQLFNVLKLVGAAYLIFIGWKSLRAKADQQLPTEQTEELPDYPIMRGLRIGFLTNALNPKATLFFLSLFSVIIKPDTPVVIQAFYGVYMSIVTAVWFCGLSLVLTQPRIRQGFRRFGHWAERLMGAALIALGLRLAIAGQE